MLVKYSADEIISRAEGYLKANTRITNYSAGAIAKSIIESIAPEIGESNQEGRGSLYNFMEEVLRQGFVSRATKEHLDLIGALFSYPRREEEGLNERGQLVTQKIDDETYRAEILQQVMSIMSANYTALRFNLLLVANVENVIPVEYALGTGSFKFIIIERRNLNDTSVLAACKVVVERYKAFGIRPLVEFPEYVPVDLKIELQFLEGTPLTKRGSIRETVRQALTNYLLDTPRGGVLVYNDIVQAIMNVSEEIFDFTVLYYAVNSTPVMLMNQQLEEDERYQVGELEVTYI